MEALMTQISNYLLRQSWQITIMVLVVAVVSWLLRNKSAHIRYLLWLIVLAKCLVPPVATVPLAILPQEGTSESASMLSIDEPIMTTEVVDMFEPESPPRRLAPAQRASRPIATEGEIRLTILQRLGAVWIAGVIIFVLIAMIKALRTELWLRRQRKVFPAGLRDQIKILFSDLNLKTFPNVWLVEGIGQPFVWGLLRGGIYLPSDFVNVNNAEQRRGILGHELSHVLRYDAAVNILQLIAQAAFWFHPFVWWANKEIRAEREKCCDEVTIAGLGAKARDYSKAIVNILISEQQIRPVPSIAVAGPVKNIEERIKTMLKPGKKFYKRPSLIAMSIVLLLALLTVPVGCVLTDRVETETSTDFKEATSNPLHHAAKNGDLEQVKKLIAAGADVNARDKRSQSPLHFAARGGHEVVARLLIAEGADVNMSTADGPWTPLLDATSGGHTKLVKLLLENGAKPYIGDKLGYTPLYYAIWFCGEESVRMLIEAGANVNACPEKDYPPLFYAVWQSHEGIVKAIIDAGADVNAEHENEDGWTPLHYALYETDADVAKLFVGTGVKVPALHNAVFEGDLDKIRQIIEGGMDIDTKDNLGWTAAYWALSAGQKDIFEYLLSEGADITARTNWGGNTFLHQASKAGFSEIVEQLIAKGIKVDDKDKHGCAPLQFASSKGHVNTVRLLVAKGANVNATSNSGGHALGDAAFAGHEEVVKLLIASGADVNLKGQIQLIAQFRGTALHAAANRGHSTIVDLLIANGADVNINAINGTPLHSAARSRPSVMQNTCAEIIKKLLAKGAEVNTKDPRQGRTPLHRAADRGRREAAELLIAAGADVNAKDRMGFTPLWYAKERDRTEIIELLSRHGAVESLYDAVGSGGVDKVKQLISKGADVNTRTDGWLITPLHMAAGEGKKEICELLIAEGAKVNAKSGELDVGIIRDSGGTPLHGACSGGHKEIVELLLAHGADVNNRTRNNMTPLDQARKNGHQEIADLLLEQGAKEGIPIRDRFENARLISSGKWIEGSFQFRTDEEWFAINVEEDKSYLIYFDDSFGTGKYTADIESYLYKDIVDDLKSKHCLFTNRHNVYQEPIKFTSDYNGKLYLRLISDNPQNTTFAIKYEQEG